MLYLANVILNILVAKLAKEMIAPRVKKMDDQHKFDPDIVQALFDNGVSIGVTNQSFSNIIIIVLFPQRYLSRNSNNFLKIKDFINMTEPLITLSYEIVMRFWIVPSVISLNSARRVLVDIGTSLNIICK